MRTERQREILRKWIRAGCIGSAVCATGFGKTRLGLGAIKMFLDRNPNCRVIVVVPSDALRIQWEEQLSSYVGDITVKVINTAASVADRCDLLVLDEMHRYASDYFSRVFDVISYSYILGLTATLERLDGQHVLLESRAPVLDRVTLREALSNGWVSSCREYEVLIDVPDIDGYSMLSKRFNAVFSFFDYDMNLVMSMIGKKGFDIKKSFASSKGCMLSDVTKNVTLFMRLLQVRKQFIYNHPKKVDIANKIISKRLDKKIITFSNTVKMADSADSLMEGKEYLFQVVDEPKLFLESNSAGTDTIDGKHKITSQDDSIVIAYRTSKGYELAKKTFYIKHESSKPTRSQEEA